MKIIIDAKDCKTIEVNNFLIGDSVKQVTIDILDESYINIIMNDNFSTIISIEKLKILLETL